MKPERVQNESNATSTDTGSEPSPAEDQKNPAAEGAANPAEKKPGATTDMKPERVQKPE